jgi:hypothetical protein
MAYEVKIITFINDREGRQDGEETLTHLVNEGWEIKAAGGGTGASMVWGFVILQRERRDIANQLERLEPDVGSDE